MPQVFGLNPIKRFNQPMWSVWNKGAYMLPPGRLFQVGFPACNFIIILYRTPIYHLGYPLHTEGAL
jgi:hypothetical protein